MFERYKVNSLQALTFNYITAGILSCLFLDSDLSIQYLLNVDWLMHAIAIGALFIVIFYLYGYGTQKAGIAITTVANKMSLIIPVSLAILLYEDALTYLKVLAFLLALFGIYLCSITHSGQLIFKRKYLWLIILIFLGQGISDSIFNDFVQKFPDEKVYAFFMVLFFFAAITGVIIHVLKYTNRKKSIKLRDAFWGILFGVPNFFCLVFFLRALAMPNLDSSIVFTLTSIGIVVSSSLIGIFLFKEILSRYNWLGIILCVCAIYIFSY